MEVFKYRKFVPVGHKCFAAAMIFKKTVLLELFFFYLKKEILKEAESVQKRTDKMSVRNLLERLEEIHHRMSELAFEVCMHACVW